MGSLIWGGNHHHNISLSICSLLATKTTLLTLISHLHSLCLTGGDPAACLMRKPHTPKINRAERWRIKYSEVVLEIKKIYIKTIHDQVKAPESRALLTSGV